MPVTRKFDRSHAARSASTQHALIKAGRKLFAEKGYHATGTHDLVAAAKVSRGALYHHFKSKEGLFEAVFRDVESDLYIAAATPVLALAFDPWLQLQEGLQARLDAIARDIGVQRIILLDGPAVLGWANWRELESEFILGPLENALKRMMEPGLIKKQPIQPLAHLIVAALNEAALLIAHAPGCSAARKDIGQALRNLITGIR